MSAASEDRDRLALLGAWMAEACGERWAGVFGSSEWQFQTAGAPTGEPTVPFREGEVLLDGKPSGWLRLGGEADADALGEALDAVAAMMGEIVQAPAVLEPTAGQAQNTVAERTWEVELRFGFAAGEDAGEVFVQVAGPVLGMCLEALGGADKADRAETERTAAAAEPGADPSPEPFPDLGGEPEEVSGAEIGPLDDVPLVISVELGSTERPLRDVLALLPGSLIHLDRPAGDPVDVLVNGRRIARAEVVVVDEAYGVRITEIVSRNERVRSGPGRTRS